jgi:ankyrin repeat protein
LGRTALHDAVEREDLASVQWLLSQSKSGGVSVQDSAGDTVLHIAARHGHRDLIHLLLNAGARSDIHTRNLKGRTVLHEVAAAGSTEALQALLDAGAVEDLTVQDEDGRTALIEAASHNNFYTYSRLLYLRGVDVNATTQDGWTALAYAVRNQNSHLIEMLLREGASLNVSVEGNYNLFDLARAYDQSGAISYLLNQAKKDKPSEP